MSKISDDFYLRDIAYRGDYVPTASGDLETITGLENLKQALLHRLLTMPGTLIHRPNYGVGIKRFQNSLTSQANKIELFAAIREQFLQDVRVESVTGISFKINDATPQLTQIIVSVKARGYDETPMTFIPFGEVA